MSGIHTRQFSAGEVAQAAEIRPATLQNWIKRGVMIGHRNIEGGGGPGRHRRFSWGNVMEVVTVAALIDVGVSDLKAAFGIAQMFAHSGEGPLPGKPGRLPGMPYDPEHGRTLMFVSGGEAEIFPFKPGDDVFSLARAALSRPEAMVVLDLLEIFDRACVSLGLHPNELLEGH
jgi:hypothetical protein